MSESKCSIAPKIRYTAPPTKYDFEPFGTLCSVLKNDDGTDTELYIQTSHNEQDPIWLSAVEVVLQRYRNELQNPCFVISCLEELQRLDAEPLAVQEKR